MRCCYGQEEVLPHTTKCCYGHEEVQPRRRTTQEQTNKMHLEWRVVAVLGWSVDTAPIQFDEVVDDVLWEQETRIWSWQSGACCCCTCSRTTAAAEHPGRAASTWWAGEVVRRDARVLRPLPLPQRTERSSG